MAYLEELLPEFRKGAKIRINSWAKDEYIYLDKNGIVYDERDKPFDFTNEELFANWELYKEPELDWDYIIKNKCLCWFSNYSANYFGYLKGREEDDNCFIDNKLNKWNNCRPVRRDEINFYEDREDE